MNANVQNRRLKRKHNSQQGFTLLEVMIAMSIFAILGLASYQLLSSELRTQERLQSRGDLNDQWQRSMMRLTRDLQQLVARSHREDYGETRAALISDGDTLELTRQGWSNPLQRPRSELQRVSYQLISSEDNSYLQRHFWPQLDRAPGSHGVQQKLFAGTLDWQLRFYDGEERQWHERWPPYDDAVHSLPQAIEVTLNSETLGDVQRLVTLSPTTDTNSKPGGGQ